MGLEDAPQARLLGEHWLEGSGMGTDGEAIFDGSTPIPLALEQLRLRLLDLTGRNRLLNFKHTAGKSLQLVPSGLDDTFTRLVGTGSRLAIEVVPDPGRDDWVERNGRMTKPEAKEHATKLGLNISFEELHSGRSRPDSALALYFSEELGKHCRKIDREARLAIEETGANMLYLAFGFLEYPDSRDAEKTFVAPLVCLPVRLDQVQEGQRVTFKLTHTGEEIEENLSLREKLKRDYSLILPQFPDEEDGIEAYFSEIELAIADQPKWRVRRSMTLALLSFANMLLVRDLDPAQWSDDKGSSLLLEHPIIKQVFRGSTESESAQYGEEYELDELPDADYPLIFDADSSQHSAIVDVMTGRSMVIEGPPGTGKSQTITNIIAACLNAGKSVLFVAQKLTALQVVKSRLQMAGLDPFLLELHSNKTSKRQVLDSISSRMALRISAPRDLEAKESSLSDKKVRLKEHAQLLNSRLGNQLGCTVHQVLWRAERSRRKLGDRSDLLSSINVVDAPSINRIDYERRRDQIGYLSKQFLEIGAFDQSHSFWGFYPESLAPGDDLAIGKVFSQMRQEAMLLSELAASIHQKFDFPVDGSLSFEGAVSIEECLGALGASVTSTTAFDILPRAFGAGDTLRVGTISAVKRAQESLTKIAALEELVAGKIDSSKIENSDFSGEDFSFAGSVGLHEFTISQLASVQDRLEKSIEVAKVSLQYLNEMAAETGVPDIGTSASFNKLRAIVTIAEKAPLQILHFRHEGLAAKNAGDVLDRCISERNRIQGLERNLDGRLYLDQAPSDIDLRTWVLTLREGPAWYRLFQKAWRVAIKGHRTLQRRKDKVPSSERLSDFDSLTELRASKAAWVNSSSLRSVVGSSTVDFGVALEPFRDVARWLFQSNEKLLGAEALSVEFSAMDVTEQQIVRIRTRAADFATSLAALDSLDATLKEVFIGNHDLLKGVDWPSKIQGATEAFLRLRKISVGLNGAIAEELTLSEARNVVLSSQEIHRLAGEISSSSGLAVLLGNRHSRLREEIADISAAMRFGQSVLESRLPLRLKSLLWAPDAQKVLSAASTGVKRISVLWASLRASLLSLDGYGVVEESKWLLQDADGALGAERTRKRIDRANDSLDELVPWSQYVYARGNCAQMELGPFVQLLESAKLTPALLTEAFSYRFHASIAETLFRHTPSLARFNGAVHSTVRSEFSALDRDVVQLRGRQIGAKCIASARPPRGEAGVRVGDKTEMNLLDHLCSQQKPRVTVRTMLKRSGRAIRELKPCFMMGPQAVAQFLDSQPGGFDVVIMDEASQMKPEEAIGAIARGKQLVVVGDPKQLPPTSFFSRSQGDGGDGDSQAQMAAVDAESILDVASSHFRPIRSLRWHYRSRHESLIAFSNEKFYRGNLVVFPSPYPRSKGLGVRSHYVTGAVYESQMNLMEAARVVDFVVDHIVHHPEQSLGVVALNIRQRDLIAELLEERLKSVRSAEKYRNHWQEEGMALFVRNLENVQGDERDAIIISTTFGPPPGASRPHQNFGPISQQGGWRRLNVLFTRARSSVLLVTSLKDTDIVVDGRTPDGTRALRDYLIFAATGSVNHDSGRETGASPESEFEESVIQALRDNGYDCVPQVGVAGFRIDIGVRHPLYPHLYLAGIECDGASYHSGITVRDRDRIRQEILESLGWKGKLWRIWSTEWFRNSRTELRRLVSFLDELKRAEVDPALIAMTAISSASSADAPEVEVQVSIESAHLTGDGLITDDGDVEVSIGDNVTYCLVGLEQPAELSVMISRSQTNLQAGIIAENTPLAQALLGSVAGEEVVLRIPGQSEKTIRIVGVRRVG